jgi:hypothetical protein
MLGASSSEAAWREFQEGLGLSANNKGLKLLFSSSRDAERSPTYIGRQIKDVDACWIDFDVQNMSFDCTEVSEIKILTSELKFLILQHNFFKCY